MARACRVASLPESLFWELTPAEVDGIMCEALDEWRAKERAADYRAALISSCLYNCHRDPKKHPEPFTPDDFLPSHEMPEPAPEPTITEVANKARNAMRILQTINPA